MTEEQQVIDAEAVEDDGEGQKSQAEQATENGAAENGAGETKQVVRHVDRTPLSQRDPVNLAKHFAASGYFKDARQMSQAVVKIVAGEELGFGPMTAMSGIHIIEGKPSLSANLIATLVQKSKPYRYRVVGITPAKAELRFFEDDEEVGVSEFTIEEAKQAGLVRSGSGWAKYPKAMLFARALTQGVRWFCPEVTAGQPAYTPEELGAQVDERGEVVAVEVEQEPAQTVQHLDPERVERLQKGIEAVGIKMADLDLLFGSLGIDGLRAHSKKARGERLSSLTNEQADALEAELQNLADKDGEG